MNFLGTHADPLLAESFRALRSSPVGQRRSLGSGLRECSLQFLPPVRNIARGSVTVDHRERGISGVCQLMKNARRNIDSLSARNDGAFGAEAHFARTFQDEIDFFLFLVVPRHLSTIGF